jgi:hypothetical protein
MSQHDFLRMVNNSVTLLGIEAVLIVLVALVWWAALNVRSWRVRRALRKMKAKNVVVVPPLELEECQCPLCEPAVRNGPLLEVTIPEHPHHMRIPWNDDVVWSQHFVAPQYVGYDPVSNLVCEYLGCFGATPAEARQKYIEKWGKQIDWTKPLEPHRMSMLDPSTRAQLMRGLTYDEIYGLLEMKRPKDEDIFDRLSKDPEISASVEKLRKEIDDRVEPDDQDRTLGLGRS